MPDQLAKLLSQLRTDKWRKDVGFSPDIQSVHKRLFTDAVDEATARRSTASNNTKLRLTLDWAEIVRKKHVPCKFFIC